jgi:CBS-domain-containing membrane protein
MKRKIIILGKKTLTRINNSRRKWMGAKLHGPPQQSFKQCAYITFGVFFTMLTVIKIASTIHSADTNFKFDSGWFSGTMCMVFALTPAPVGQPRQIFGAHLWNILVGLAIRQIPSGTSDFMEWNSLNPNSYGLPLIWKQALAVSIGVSGQAKLGLLHPPATALSFAFVSSNNYSWGTIASVILADAVVVAMAVIILNLEEKKQYPLFWLGFGWEDSGGTFWAIQQKVNAVSTNLKGMRSVKGDENNV